MRRYVRFLICLLAVVLAGTVSAVPSEKDKSAAAEPKRDSHDLVVVEGEDAKTNTKPDEASAKKSEADWALVGATAKLGRDTIWLAAITGAIGVIAVFQLWMFYRQLRVLRATLIAANRPRIILRVMTMSKDLESPVVAGHSTVIIRFYIANVGGSSGTILHSAINAKMVERKNLDSVTYNGQNIGCKTKRFDSGDTEIASNTINVGGSEAQVFSPGQDECFVVYGYLVYEDEVGARRQSYFYRIWNESKGRFDKSQDEDLEYEY